jgi:hypothetical protein
VSRVWYCNRKIIGENRQSLIKADATLAKVRFGFVSIPLEKFWHDSGSTEWTDALMDG